MHEWKGRSRLTIGVEIMKEYQKHKIQKMASDAGGENQTDPEVKNFSEESVGIQMTRV